MVNVNQYKESLTWIIFPICMHADEASPGYLFQPFIGLFKPVELNLLIC
jgi:hypothetical protein